MTRPWQGIIGQKFSAEGFADYCRSIALHEWRPEFLVLHNTGDPTFAEWHNVAGAVRMRGLAGYYRDDMHWSAGPHLFVADDGIWVFTPLTVHGVHSPSWNEVSWGVELVGDYDHEPLGDDLKQNAMSAMASLHELAGWGESNIRLHKEDPETTHSYCPGVNVIKAEFEAGINTYLDLGR